MKVTKIFAVGLMAMTLMTPSCTKDEPTDTPVDEKVADIDVTSDNIKSWANYMKVVSKLLKDDASTLNSEWVNSYATAFKNHTLSDYTSASSCVEQVIDGCIDIATEVGEAKIGDPLDLYNNGKKTQALYAVESWYSWHSIDDYSNNILSIRNAYLGSLDGKAAENSISSLVANSEGVAAMKVDGATLDKMMQKAITDAYDAIQAIPAPFRNNINSKEAGEAQDACAALANSLERLKSMLDKFDEEELEKVVINYVDKVVLPTYDALEKKNNALHEAVVAFAENPSDKAFEQCASAWLEARQPWETSEAFLFGPVAEKGLDPNMDSWPLDQAGIINILKSGKFESLEWDGEYDEENQTIEEAQGLRGYHTLEFLIFKDGKARTIR